jgi:hypothetical protein
VVALALIAVSCNGDDGDSGAVGGSAADIIADRGLTDANVEAALKTYMPSGEWDEYVMFASGDAAAEDHRRLHPRALARMGLRERGHDGCLRARQR